MHIHIHTHMLEQLMKRGQELERKQGGVYGKVSNEEKEGGNGNSINSKHRQTIFKN